MKQRAYAESVSKKERWVQRIRWYDHGTISKHTKLRDYVWLTLSSRLHFVASFVRRVEASDGNGERRDVRPRRYLRS